MENAKAEALAVINKIQREYEDEIEVWTDWQLDFATSNGTLLRSISLAQSLH
jgi:hypothetical protein